MLTKRIIPCLDVKDGRVVKGTSFVQLRDAGDPVELAAYYYRQGADELVFLDISATPEGRDTLVDIVERISKEVFMPLTVGGGLRTTADIRRMLNAGADKISINTAAVLTPNLITEGAEKFGSQCIVVAIDAGASPAIVNRAGRSIPTAVRNRPALTLSSGQNGRSSWGRAKSCSPASMPMATGRGMTLS